jgi:hypothetical protein
LLVADKLKEVLPANCLTYILSLENDKCFTPSQIASNADIFVSNYDVKGVYHGTQVSNIKLDGPVGYEYTRKHHGGGARVDAGPVNKGKIENDAKQLFKGKTCAGGEKVTPSTPRLCYECQSRSHLAYQCDLRAKKRASEEGYFTVQNKTCIALEHGLMHVKYAETTKDSCVIMSDCEKVELTKENCTQSVDVDKFVGQVEIALLTYLDICINGTRQRALVDSGSQVPIIRADRLHDNPTTTGSIYIQGIVGPAQCRLELLHWM